MTCASCKGTGQVVLLYSAVPCEDCAIVLTAAPCSHPLTMYGTGTCTTCGERTPLADKLKLPAAPMAKVREPRLYFRGDDHAMRRFLKDLQDICITKKEDTI